MKALGSHSKTVMSVFTGAQDTELKFCLRCQALKVKFGPSHTINMHIQSVIFQHSDFHFWTFDSSIQIQRIWLS